MSSSSIITRPTSSCRPRSRWSIPTGATISPGSAISPRSVLTFVTVVAVNRELRRRGFWSEARPEPDLLSFLHLVALGTVADVVPLKGLNRAFVCKGLIALRRREHVGLTALMDVARLERPAGALSSRLSARAAHQCRRPHRPRRSRRAAVDGKRSGRSRAHRRRARSAQPRASGDRAANAGAGRSGSHGGARSGGEGRGGGDRGGRLASRRGRARRRAAEGTLRPARLCHRHRPGGHRHRLRAAPSPASISARRCGVRWRTAC